ncbi:Plasmid mobilization relaxosome protein MobC, partial [Dysosmobacter welbionis]
ACQLELVPHAPHRFQRPLAADVFDLLPQPLDVDIHCPAVAEVVKAPHLIQQLVPGVHPVGGGGQMIQQLQLLGGRVDFLPIHDQLVGVQVNHQLVERQPLAGVVGDL